MKPGPLLIFVLPLFLTACGLTPQQKADYAKVEHRGLSPAIYDKMLHGEPLGICDIESLSGAGVDNGIILRYLQDHNIVYYLSVEDVRQMERAGVDHEIIESMLLSARGSYWSPGPYPFFGSDPHSYDHGFYSGYFSGFSYGGFGWGHHP